MSNFSTLLEAANNSAPTANGGVANASTLNSVLNLFANGGAMRTRSEKEISTMISLALAEDFELGLKALFYLGDVRGGQGERRLLKIGLKVLAERYPDVAIKIIHLIPEYFRWDYLYEFVGTPIADAAAKVFKEEFLNTFTESKTSLMYKWLKAENSKNPAHKALGIWTAKALGYPLTPQGFKSYRKMLSEKRALLKEAVVETYLSQKGLDEVEYDKVCSKAGLRYKTAFYRRGGDRYQQYVKDVTSGSKKVNAAVLNPVDVVHEYMTKHGFDAMTENFWKSLKDFVPKNDEQAMVVGDFSGSMWSSISKNSSVTAYEAALAMVLFTAEKLSGPFKDKAIVFSSNSRYIDLSRAGTTLYDRIQYIRANFSDVSNTNLISVFRLILNTAISNRVPQSDLPTKLIIVSDMQFNPIYVSGSSGNLENIRALDAIRLLYQQAGYTLPEIVYWNVMGTSGMFPATKHDTGVAMVSGYSASILKSILSGKFESPEDLMRRTLNVERYAVLSEILGLHI